MGTAEKLREAERLGVPLDKRLELAVNLAKLSQIQLNTARLRLKTLEASTDVKARSQIEVCKCDLRVKEIEDRIARVNRRQLQRSLIARRKEEKRQLEGKAPKLGPEVVIPTQRKILNWETYFKYCRGWRPPIDHLAKVLETVAFMSLSASAACTAASQLAETAALDSQKKVSAIDQVTDDEKEAVLAELARQRRGADAKAIGLASSWNPTDLESKKTKVNIPPVSVSKTIQNPTMKSELLPILPPSSKKVTDSDIKQKNIENDAKLAAHPLGSVQLPTFLEDLSSELTYSLTAFTCLARLGMISNNNLRRVLEIHVIGADWKEGRSVDASIEIFSDLAVLLQHSSVKYLNITLIGPHTERTLVNKEFTNLSVIGVTDDACIPKLCIRYSDMNEGEYAPPPHICFCFNAGVWVFDEWTPTILHIYENIRVPLVVTSYNIHESNEDMDTMQEIGIDSSDWCFGPELNPFRSFKKADKNNDLAGVASNACVQCIWKDCSAQYPLHTVTNYLVRAGFPVELLNDTL